MFKPISLTVALISLAATPAPPPASGQTSVTVQAATSAPRKASPTDRFGAPIPAGSNKFNVYGLGPRELRAAGLSVRAGVRASQGLDRASA